MQGQVSLLMEKYSPLQCSWVPRTLPFIPAVTKIGFAGKLIGNSTRVQPSQQGLAQPSQQQLAKPSQQEPPVKLEYGSPKHEPPDQYEEQTGDVVPDQLPEVKTEQGVLCPGPSSRRRRGQPERLGCHTN